MTPFALVHLAASWSSLTSLALDITPAAAAARGWGGEAPLALLCGLSSLSNLRDLSLRMAGEAVSYQYSNL
jgi:hypothetical protein